MTENNTVVQCKIEQIYRKPRHVYSKHTSAFYTSNNIMLMNNEFKAQTSREIMPEIRVAMY